MFPFKLTFWLVNTQELRITWNFTASPPLPSPPLPSPPRSRSDFSERRRAAAVPIGKFEADWGKVLFSKWRTTEPQRTNEKMPWLLLFIFRFLKYFLNKKLDYSTRFSFWARNLDDTREEMDYTSLTRWKMFPRQLDDVSLWSKKVCPREVSLASCVSGKR